MEIQGVNSSSRSDRVKFNNVSDVSGTGKATPAEGAGSLKGFDTIEISNRARYLEALKNTPEIRQSLVDGLKEQIARSTYENAERVETAVRQFVDQEL